MYRKRAFLHEAETVIEEDIATCRAIGENGLSLLSDGMGLLTHCNAGQLSTVKYGTALAPMSTVCLDTPSGDKMPIEQRSSSEVTDMWHKRPCAVQRRCVRSRV